MAPAGRIWGSVPARNRSFVGREQVLKKVRTALLSGESAVVQALHGIGGIGKTQLAIEYAHQFASEYDVVWWMNWEQPGLIGEQFAALAEALGCAAAGTPLAKARLAVLNELRERRRWLLVFDNVEQPDAVADWLPAGTGHVLITSRACGWDEIAVPVEIDVFSRAESVALLRRRVPGLTDGIADRVADALGDLPLAIAQAAGFMALTAIQPEEYIALLANRPVEVLDTGTPSSHPRSLVAAIQISFDRIRAEDPPAAQVAAICALLAAEPVPTEWFVRAAGELPAALSGRAADPVAWRQVVSRLADSALVRVDRDCIVMHRLTQAIISAQLRADEASVREVAVRVVAACQPGPPEVPAAWPGWARLLPHLLALDPGRSDSEPLRRAACYAAWYLIDRGDDGAAQDLARQLYTHWRARLGADYHGALSAARCLARALRSARRYAEARQLDEDTFVRRQRLFGSDAPLTLLSANDLAVDLYELGEVQAARALAEETLARRRLVLGDQHPHTLDSVHNLSMILNGMGHAQAGHTLAVDSLARSRQALGGDHPDTLTSAYNLAADLHDMGDTPAARKLEEDTLARRRRVLGDDHPNTLRSADALGVYLRNLGELHAARDLHAETLARRRRVLGDYHPETIRTALQLGEDQRLLGEA